MLTPTLKGLQYDANPPRCGNCRHRFVKSSKRQDGKRKRTLMCALAQASVHSRGVCDRWCGFNGETLDAV